MRISVLAVMAGALAGCATPAGQGLGRGAMPAAASSEEQASATSSWKWRCERGFAVDCRKLGRAHLHGTGVPRDDRLAAAYLVKACEIGEPASYALGIPGSGGFHPSDLAARAAGQRGAHDRFERLPFEAWGSLPPALRGRLQLDAPAEAGALGDEAVELLVALRRSQLATCLERERSQPAATSLASVFMLEAGGRPVDLRTASEPADPGLEGCAREVILDWSFPVPADGRSGPHLVRIDYEAALPGPAPGYASSGGLRAALKEPGCVERRLRLAEGDRGAEKAVTVKLAVDADGRPALFHALTPAPEPVVLAIGAAVRACEFTPGVGDDGRPLPLWLTLTVKLDGR